MKKILVYALTLMLLATLVAAGLMLREQRQQQLAATPAPAPAPWSVRTASVERGRTTQGFPALALVKGANEVIAVCALLRTQRNLRLGASSHRTYKPVGVRLDADIAFTE